MILKNIKELKKVLKEPKNIVVIGHKNPDGDAVGSTIALNLFLKKQGHKSSVILPNKFPDFLEWVPKTEEVLLFDKQESECLELFKKADLIFLLDLNTLSRVGNEMMSVLQDFTKDIALIDHHQQPDEFEYMYSDTSICSTCQMIYHFIEMLEQLDLIDKQIATCLYTGIMTDTGSFRYRATSSTTHRIIAELIDKGAENFRIHSNTFDSQSLNRLKLLGCALNNLTVLEEHSTAYITISQEEKDRFGFQRGYTDGVVNYALAIKNINLAAIFIEDKEQEMIKISFRSKGKFSVNKFARNYFEGGGHDNAAGGKSLVNMEETVSKFLELIPKYSEEINASYE